MKYSPILQIFKSKNKGLFHITLSLSLTFTICCRAKNEQAQNIGSNKNDEINTSPVYKSSSQPVIDSEPQIQKEITRYSDLINAKIRSGKLKDGLNLLQEMNLKYPGQIKPLPEYIKQDWENIEKTALKMDSLDHSGLPSYEILWRKGKAMSWLCSNCYFFVGEGCFNYATADSIFKIILRKYPKSNRSDEAQFELNSFCHEGEDGSDHPEEVEVWQKFLKKYPESNLRPNALVAMAWALSRSEADLVKGLKWLNEAKQISPGLFEQDSVLYGIPEVFQTQLDIFQTEVSLSLEKNKIHTGEAVEITFYSKNLAQTSKKIKIIKANKYPNFSIVINREGNEVDLTFIESNKYEYPTNDLDWETRVLKPGKPYQETWDITQTARRNNNAILGRYVFDRPGRYQIIARSNFWGVEKYSKPVILEVE